MLFGIGWGLVGLCPEDGDGNLAELVAQRGGAFVVAMAVGMLGHDLLPARTAAPAAQDLAPANAADG